MDFEMKFWKANRISFALPLREFTNLKANHNDLDDLNLFHSLPPFFIHPSSCWLDVTKTTPKQRAWSHLPSLHLSLHCPASIFLILLFPWRLSMEKHKQEKHTACLLFLYLLLPMSHPRLLLSSKNTALKEKDVKIGFFSFFFVPLVLFLPLLPAHVAFSLG